MDTRIIFFIFTYSFFWFTVGYIIGHSRGMGKAVDKLRKLYGEEIEELKRSIIYLKGESNGVHR